MTKYTIELTGAFAIAKGSREKTWQSVVTCDLAALPESIILDLIRHGLKQKVADAASGAKTEAEATGPMQKALDAILKGEWSSRGEGSDGASMETIVGRSVMRNAFKLKVGAKSPEWAKFTGLSDADQLAKLDAWLAGPQGVALAEPIAKEIALRKERAANKADAAKAVEFDI